MYELKNCKTILPDAIFVVLLYAIFILAIKLILAKRKQKKGQFDSFFYFLTFTKYQFNWLHLLYIFFKEWKRCGRLTIIIIIIINRGNKNLLQFIGIVRLMFTSLKFYYDLALNLFVYVKWHKIEYETQNTKPLDYYLALVTFYLKNCTPKVSKPFKANFFFN